MSSFTSMPSKVNQSFETLFDNLIAQYIAQSNTENKGLLTYYESEWPSPCYNLCNNPCNNEENNQYHDGDELEWQPVTRAGHPNLSNLEEALTFSIPIELQTLFCRYYSHDINANADNGPLTILQAWNEDDFERLQKNLIAHVLMKRRLKQADTLFFASTDEDDFVLSILLETGAVVLEEVGKEPCREIAPNLHDFMTQLSPRPCFVSL